MTDTPRNDPQAASWEIREDPDGTVDELVLRQADLVHVEMLDDSSAYLGFHFDDGTFGQIEVQATKKGTLRLSVSTRPDDQPPTQKSAGRA